MVIMLTLGIVSMFLFISQVAFTKTVYSFNLGRTGEVYEGGFIIPDDIVLSNKTYVTELEISYYGRSTIKRNDEFVIEIMTPSQNFTSKIILRTDKDSWKITTNERLNEFIPENGNYTIKFYPRENITRAKVSLVKMRVKEVRQKII